LDRIQHLDARYKNQVVSTKQWHNKPHLPLD
jgi:hypothetical protein